MNLSCFRQVKHNGVTALLGLLSHENADIAVDAVGVFAELLNPEVLQTEEEEAGAFNIVDCLVCTRIMLF